MAKRKTRWIKPGDPGAQHVNFDEDEYPESIRIQKVFGDREDFDELEDWMQIISGESTTSLADDEPPYVQPDDPAYQIDTLEYLIERIVDIIKILMSAEFPDALQNYVTELNAFAIDLFPDTDFGKKIGELAARLDFASKEIKAKGLLRTDLQNARSAFVRMKKEIEKA